MTGVNLMLFLTENYNLASSTKLYS